MISLHRSSLICRNISISKYPTSECLRVAICKSAREREIEIIGFGFHRKWKPKPYQNFGLVIFLAPSMSVRFGISVSGILLENPIHNSTNLCAQIKFYKNRQHNNAQALPIVWSLQLAYTKNTLKHFPFRVHPMNCETDEWNSIIRCPTI